LRPQSDLSLHAGFSDAKDGAPTVWWRKEITKGSLGHRAISGSKGMNTVTQKTVKERSEEAEAKAKEAR
jgi:hypothetical protein